MGMVSKDGETPKKICVASFMGSWDDQYCLGPTLKRTATVMDMGVMPSNLATHHLRDDLAQVELAARATGRLES